MSFAPIFRDRAEAGEQLARAIVSQMADLTATGISAKPIVYALPRGGLPVAAPVARALGCPLDIVVAKKITRIQNPELAIGAVTADGHVIWSRSQLLKPRILEAALHHAQEKAQTQYSLLAPFCPHLSAEGTIAILIDDGIATGMTMAVAAQSLRAKQPAQLWIGAPVAPPELMESLQQWSDRVIVLTTPHPFLSVSRFYEEFLQVETTEARSYLQQHNSPSS